MGSDQTFWLLLIPRLHTGHTRAAQRAEARAPRFFHPSPVLSVVDGSGPPAAEARLSEGGPGEVDVAVEVEVEEAEVAEVVVVEEGGVVMSSR